MGVVSVWLDRRPAWLPPVGVAALVGAAVGALAWLDPALRAELQPSCPFRTLTGLDCPGCGGTRAVHALAQGDVALAADHNLLLFVILPLLVWGWIGWFSTSLGRREQPPNLPPIASMSLAGVVAVFWVVRNLPWSSVAWLGSAAGGG